MAVVQLHIIYFARHGAKKYRRDDIGSARRAGLG
jgi:hypothetical protein